MNRAKTKTLNNSSARPVPGKQVVSKPGFHNKLKKSSFSSKPDALAKGPAVTITPVEGQTVAPLKLKMSSAANKPAGKASPVKAAAVSLTKSLSSSSKTKKKLPEFKVKVRFCSYYSKDNQC